MFCCFNKDLCNYSSVAFNCDTQGKGHSICSNMLVIDDNFSSTSSEHDVIFLQELCSNASPEQILLCLNKHDGDVNRAAQELLGVCNTFIPGKWKLTNVLKFFICNPLYVMWEC